MVGVIPTAGHRNICYKWQGNLPVGAMAQFNSPSVEAAQGGLAAMAAYAARHPRVTNEDSPNKGQGASRCLLIARRGLRSLRGSAHPLNGRVPDICQGQARKPRGSRSEAACHARRGTAGPRKALSDRATCNTARTNLAQTQRRQQMYLMRPAYEPINSQSRDQVLHWQAAQRHQAGGKMVGVPRIIPLNPSSSKLNELHRIRRAVLEFAPGAPPSA